jgi:hypothetical protein
MSAWKKYAVGAAAILGASGIAYYLYQALRKKEEHKEPEKSNDDDWESVSDNEEREEAKINAPLIMDESLVESWDIINHFAGLREQIEALYPKESEEKEAQLKELNEKCKK